MISIKKDNDYVKALLKQDEGIQLDFKQNISNSLKVAKTIAAFANTSGGKLVIGISDKKQIIGIDADEEMYMIDQANIKHVSPPVSIYYEIFEVSSLEDEKPKSDTIILIAHILESNSKPHAFVNGQLSKIFYYRQGDKSLPMIDEI